jgi:Undecaprenyl-phosphate galactose phosphotransferase WbaP
VNKPVDRDTGPREDLSLDPRGGRPGDPVRAFGGPARSYRVTRWLLLAASDATALFLSGTLAYLAWARPVREQAPGLYLGLVPLLALFLLGYAQAGLYPGFGLGPVETLRRTTLVTAFGFVVLAAVSFAFKLPYRYSRVTFVIALTLALLLVPLVRSLVQALGRRRPGWPEPVVVIGQGEVLATALAAEPSLLLAGYRPVGVLTTGEGPAPGVPVLGGLERAPELAARGIRVALLAEVEPSPALLDRLQQSFERTVMLRRYGELPVEGLQVRNFGGALGIEFTNNLLRRHNRLLKRSLDLVLGTLALALALPLLALSALLVRLVSRGPVLFFQQRAGLGGRPIRVPKVRTMFVDAEARLEAFLATDPALREEWERHMKLRRDPRLLPGVGRLLRRFSLDELPQLFSVISGDMSLVGPRPFPPYHLERFGTEFRELRQRVRPGVTGLWQVAARGEGSLTEQEAYDSYYIRNWSLWLDLYILARTVGAVVSGRGAY